MVFEFGIILNWGNGQFSIIIYTNFDQNRIKHVADMDGDTDLDFVVSVYSPYDYFMNKFWSMTEMLFF